jgi:hypothetical protein
VPLLIAELTGLEFSSNRANPLLPDIDFLEWSILRTPLRHSVCACPVSLGQNKTFHFFKEAPRSTQWDCGISISSSWACLSCRASEDFARSRFLGFTVILEGMWFYIVSFLREERKIGWIV